MTEALYNERGDVPDHIVSGDGLNADCVRESGRVIAEKFPYLVIELGGYVREAEGPLELLRSARAHRRPSCRRDGQGDGNAARSGRVTLAERRSTLASWHAATQCPGVDRDRFCGCARRFRAG